MTIEILHVAERMTRTVSLIMYQELFATGNLLGLVALRSLERIDADLFGTHEPCQSSYR